MWSIIVEPAYESGDGVVLEGRGTLPEFPHKYQIKFDLLNQIKSTFRSSVFQISHIPRFSPG